MNSHGVLSRTFFSFNNSLSSRYRSSAIRLLYSALLLLYSVVSFQNHSSALPSSPFQKYKFFISKVFRPTFLIFRPFKELAFRFFNMLQQFFGSFEVYAYSSRVESFVKNYRGFSRWQFMSDRITMFDSSTNSYVLILSYLSLSNRSP